MGFPGGSDGKESACSAENLSSIPGLGGSPGEENSYPLQYCSLQNSMDRGAWWAIHSPWCYKESDTTERQTFSFLNYILVMFTCLHIIS